MHPRGFNPAAPFVGATQRLPSPPPAGVPVRWPHSPTGWHMCWMWVRRALWCTPVGSTTSSSLVVIAFALSNCVCVCLAVAFRRLFSKLFNYAVAIVSPSCGVGLVVHSPAGPCTCSRCHCWLCRPSCGSHFTLCVIAACLSRLYVLLVCLVLPRDDRFD